MRFLGYILAIPAAVLTWFILSAIAGSISQSLAAFTVLLIGPFCGWWAGVGVVAAFAKMADDEQAATEAEKMRKQEEARQRANAAAELERQKKRLSSLLATTQRTFLSIPELVPSADLHLDRAEHEFADGAFAPFWDEVEHATNKLAAYHEGIRSVSHNADDYEQSASKLTITIPKFTLPEGELPDARPVAERLTQIVRAAQRNFQFSTIYEQRKANQLLYAGFGTLGAAISSMGRSISSSLDELSESVHSSLDNILQATREQTESLADHHDSQLRQASADSDARRDFEKKVLATESEQTKMLDNIQRKRKPFP